MRENAGKWGEMGKRGVMWGEMGKMGGMCNRQVGKQSIGPKKWQKLNSENGRTCCSITVIV